MTAAGLAIDHDDDAESGVGHVEEARVDPHVAQHRARRRQVLAESVDAAHAVGREVDLHQLRAALDHGPVMRRGVVDDPQVVLAVGVDAVGTDESIAAR